MNLLEINDLRVHFPVREGFVLERVRGQVRAVDGVSLSVRQGEVVGLVGESGCGKSTLARSIVRLVPVTSGAIRFEGVDLATLHGEALRAIRPRLQMIFQDPYASLDPRRTVYDTLAEPLLTHRTVPRDGVAAEVAALMDRVGLAKRFLHKYPHEFSGGQRQRIAIARSLAPRPRLVLADEPVSALDVSVQAQILNLLRELVREMGLTMLLISHDLSVVRHMAQRIAVMYLGRIVELGPATEVIDRARHPYTQALVSAVPVPDPGVALMRPRIVLTGELPSPVAPPSGCAFHPRCRHANADCANTRPELTDVDPTHTAACLRLDEVGVVPELATV